MVIRLPGAVAHCDGDADPELDPKNIVLRTAQCAVSVNVSMQVNMVNASEVSEKVLLHPVEGVMVDKAVVTDKTDNAVVFTQTVYRPTEEADVWVIELIF